ncbi:MAG: phosphomannomutase/phosphoglucomutase [Candidatus Micrarchaeota archaeon]|nr:phosphomannomutase/phosphoglucomutase [Candidatus Micrarchaeota archaeon]
MNDKIFRSYDIRGIYPKDIDEKVAENVGFAFGTYIGAGKRIALSNDSRLSADKLRDAAVKGLLRSGVKVMYIGMASSPMLYFTVAHYGFDGGLGVTASHNPPEWNGFKLCAKGGKVIGLESGLLEIKRLMLQEQSKADPAPYAGLVGIEDMAQKARKDYESFVLGKVKVGRELRIGVDPGNGAWSGIAGEMLKDAGMAVSAINDLPDGNFPGRNPEPKPDSLTELRNLVTHNQLDFGVAFDADGDRAVFVDENGEVLDGDVALSLMIKGSLKKGEAVVYEVSCSDAVPEVIAEKGGKPVLSKVGHSFIKENMVASKAVIGGEISGHMYFKEVYGMDDAFFATMKMVEILSNGKDTLSKLVSELPRYERTYMEFDADDSVKAKIVEILKKRLAGKGYKIITIDGAKVVTGDGWFILRVSNTTPKVKMRAEARTKKRLDELVKEASSEFAEAAKGASQ